MALRQSDTGLKLCSQCNGETTCNCATCGIETTTHARGMGARMMEAGICNVCQGHGHVVDPNYQYPKSV